MSMTDQVGSPSLNGSGQAEDAESATTATAVRVKDFLGKPRRKAPDWSQLDIDQTQGRSDARDQARHAERQNHAAPAKKRTAKLALVRLSDVKPEKVKWLWYPYIPKGKVTSIEGDPGVGKSWLTTAIAAAISKGQRLPGQDHARFPQTVLMLTAEDGLGDTVRPRLEALGANLDNIHALDGPITLNGKGLDQLEEAIIKTHPAAVFIDPLVAYMGGKVDLHRANEVRVFMSALAGVAEKHRCAVVPVRHLRKSRGGAAIYQGLGSIDITAACRSVLMVGKDHDQRVMAHAKCNLASFGSSLAYDIEDGRFKWIGKVRTTAEDLAAEPDDQDTRNALEEALDFLEERLRNGPVPSADLDMAAKEADISERTLKRARRKRGVRAKQIDKCWVCSLPPQGHKL